MKEYLYEGKNEEELILKMLNELGVKEDEILYVTKEETVGLLKKKKVTIKAILKTDVLDRKSTRLNSSHANESRMPSSA